MGGCIVGAYGITDWDMVQRVDHLLDDGNLLTGMFVRHSWDGPDPNGPMAGWRIMIE